MAQLFNVAAMGLEKYSAQFGKLVRTVGGENGTRIFEQFQGGKRILTCVNNEGKAVRRRVTGKTRVYQKNVDARPCGHRFEYKQDYNLVDGSSRIVSRDAYNSTTTVRCYNGAGEVESLTLNPSKNSPDRIGNAFYSLHNYNTNQHMDVTADYSYMNINAYGVKGGKHIDYALTDELSIPKGGFTLSRYGGSAGQALYDVAEQGNVKKVIEKNYANTLGQYFRNMLKETGLII